MTAVRIGLDIAKDVFQIHGVDRAGRAVIRRRLRRAQVKEFFQGLPRCTVGMESGSGAHHWARELIALGHEVRLISAQFVRPYVKGNKNDANDAEAICEVITRPGMRFVGVKSEEQQELQSVHRVRAGLIKARTAKANQMRGLLAEYGIVLPRRIDYLRRAWPRLAEADDLRLSAGMRRLLCGLYEDLTGLDRRVAELDEQLRKVYRESAMCRKLGAVEGIGPVVATALVAAIGDPRTFRNGRGCAAWLGLVPRQHSSGGRPRLGGISKRGDRYVRTLLIHGARSVVARAHRKQDPRSRWIVQMTARRHRNVVAVALANKNARIAWALLRYEQDYRSAAA